MRVGSLFSGYGGLELGVSSVLGGTLEWYAEVDKAPAAIMAHHHPDVPNLGDVTKVDWVSVPPVDAILGGSPCQDLSGAGKRAGMRPGTRSGLWASMCDAVDIIRPRLVVWENVRGALSAPANSAVEPCPFCVGGPDVVTLRALGRVLGDLAELGYDAWWGGLPASGVGAPHPRYRVFLFATPADPDDSGWVEHGRPVTVRAEQPAPQRPRDDTLTLLPTPVVNDMGASYTPETWDEWCERQKDAHGNGNGHGKSLSIEAQRLLPTPTASEATGPGAHGTGGPNLRTVVATTPWGEYADAIERWENLTRPAPEPTEDGKLSPAFVEWMMGLPAGHVTDPRIPIARNARLKALGNGVVPQQAAAATRAFLAAEGALVAT